MTTLPAGLVQSEASAQEPIQTLDELYRDHVTKTLDHYAGDVRRTASALGVTYNTIYAKLHQWGLFEKYAKRPRKKSVKIVQDGEVL